MVSTLLESNRITSPSHLLTGEGRGEYGKWDVTQALLMAQLYHSSMGTLEYSELQLSCGHCRVV